MRLSQYFETFSNPVQVLLWRFGFIKDCRLRIRGYNVTFKADRLRLYPYYETFKTDTHNSKLREHTVVIDIGAFTGDTAVFYALKNKVDMVIAIEPYPEAYEMLKVNVLENNMEGKVTVENYGVSDKTGELQGFWSLENYCHFIGSFAKHETLLVKSLNDILESISSDNVFIKCDAEGFEHRIFNKDVDLAKVYGAEIEYNNTFGNIPDILRTGGFIVKIDYKSQLIRATKAI